MANRHRRHSSVDTLGWMYTNCADEPPAASAHPIDRSISTRIASFRREVFPAIKRQTSIRFNPGEYFTGCFGPRETKLNEAHGSLQPILLDTDHTPAHGRPPRSRSRSLSTSFLGNFNFGSMMFKEKHGEDKLEMRASELNHKAATQKDRVLQPGGRWIMEEDDDYYHKPPAWKQALRKLRAEAKRHVHPAPQRESLYYDAEDYEKNFDEKGRGSLSVVVDDDDDFGMKARILHTKLLVKLHSQGFDDALGQQSSPAKLLKTTSVPIVPVKASPKGKDDCVPIWQRRLTARPLTNLELTRSL